MNRLQSEWQRLYLAHSPESAPLTPSTACATDSPASAPTPPTPGDAMTEAAAGNTPSLVTPGGRVRALVLELGRPADWDALLAVWQGVQADLALPAPTIAVSGTDAYQLWFSVAQKCCAGTTRRDRVRRPYAWAWHLLIPMLWIGELSAPLWCRLAFR